MESWAPIYLIIFISGIGPRNGPHLRHTLTHPFKNLIQKLFLKQIWEVWIPKTHTIHVWYIIIYLHLVDLYGTCRVPYMDGIWEMVKQRFSSLFLPFNPGLHEWARNESPHGDQVVRQKGIDHVHQNVHEPGIILRGSMARLSCWRLNHPSEKY